MIGRFDCYRRTNEAGLEIIKAKTEKYRHINSMMMRKRGFVGLIFRRYWRGNSVEDSLLVVPPQWQVAWWQG